MTTSTSVGSRLATLGGNGWEVNPTFPRNITDSAPSLNDYGPTNPLYIAHRGGSLVAPESSQIAYRDILAGGRIVAIEQDGQATSDGLLVVMHDLTVDRTTTSTGNVSAFTAAQWAAMAIDATAQNIVGYSNLVRPAVFADVLRAFKGQAIFVPEVKVVTVAQSLVDALLAAGIPRDQALVSSFVIADLAPTVAAGYPAMYVTTTAADIAACQAAGITWVAISDGAADAVFAAWITAGFKVVAYITNQRYRRDQLLALGVSGFYSDDPEYLATNAPMSTTDPFDNGKWAPGMFADSFATTEALRGTISGGYFGWPTLSSTKTWTTMGWASPVGGNVANNNFSITLTAKYNSAFGGDATKWLSIFIPDLSMADRVYTDSLTLPTEKGYTILARKNGAAQIYRLDGAAGATSLGTGTIGAAIADAEEVTLRVTITPTQIKIARLAGGSEIGSLTVSDSNYRSGYFQLGKSGLAVLVKDIIVA